MVNLADVLFLKDDIVVRSEDHVLFDTRKNIIIECNEVGFEILSYIDGEQNVQKIIERLEQSYDAESVEIKKAVLEFLEMSLVDGLIEIKI